MYYTETEILVPFHDVDSMGIVWHGHYLKYFEVARCEFLNSIDYNYRSMADSGYGWPVIDTRLKFVKPVHFDQKILVRCTLREWEYRLKIDYLIEDLTTKERLTKGYTIQVAVDLDSGSMCFDSPPILKEKLLKKIGHLDF